MIPKDKFGNSIYSQVFEKLVRIGNQLLTLGYKESYNKPNLFYKKIESEATIINFLDMRGTDVIKIWEEPIPMIYQKIEAGEDWQIGRTVKKEMELLKKNNVPYRFSFEGMLSGSNIDEDFLDGYCRVCKKDMRANNEFCSIECEEKHRHIQQIELEKEELEWKRIEQEEKTKRKNEKEKGGNPLIYTHPNKTLESWMPRYCYKRFCNYKDSKTAIRHLRDFLIREGVLGYRIFCQVDGCNEGAIPHEISYNFDELFNQENYIFLCYSHHKKMHNKMKPNSSNN